MLDKRISREGTLLMKGGEVFLDGWEIHPGGMCREVAILACLYTARRLLEFASRLTREGGSAPVCSDMPRETPRDWLCPRTREFDAMFESSAQETRARNIEHTAAHDCACGECVAGETVMAKVRQHFDERRAKCFADCGDSCQCERYPPAYCKTCNHTTDQCVCPTANRGA